MTSSPRTQVLLATQRLILRPLEASDAEAMLHYRADPAVCLYQGFAPQRIEEVRAFVAENAAARLDGSEGWHQLAMQERASGQLVGDCGVRFERTGRQAEIGITVSPLFQGRGLAREALEAVFQHLFQALGVHRIVGSVDPRNLRSMHLLQRLGMRQEALHLQSLWFKGAWADDAVFAMLNDEWSARR